MDAKWNKLYLKMKMEKMMIESEYLKNKYEEEFKLLEQEENEPEEKNDILYEDEDEDNFLELGEKVNCEVLDEEIENKLKGNTIYEYFNLTTNN